MTNPFIYETLRHPEDAQHLGNLLAQCFNSPSQESGRYVQRIGVENFRILRQRDRLIGGLAVIPMGQWWGNQPVPMTGIAAVGIAPDLRGEGAAITLLRHTLYELHDAGVPISVLYPAAQQLYRRVGYEQAGTYNTWTIPASMIHVRSRSIAVQPVTPVHAEAFLDMQQRYAQQQQGHLDRHLAIWQSVLDSATNTNPTYAYTLGDLDHPEGYVVYSQHSQNEETILRIRDWAILTPQAGRSLWAFLASHRSQVSHIRWQSSPVDALSLLLPEQTAAMRSTMRWMLRIIHVEAALSKRGYPPALNTELHLAIQDDLLTNNSGNFVLSVADGKGAVTRGGRGDLRLHIRGLAPLYTGLFTAQQLQQAGQLEATDAALMIASHLFVSVPWLPDFF